MLSWTNGLVGLGVLAGFGVSFFEVAWLFVGLGFFAGKTYFGSRKIYLRKNVIGVLSKS